MLKKSRPKYKTKFSFFITSILKLKERTKWGGFRLTVIFYIAESS